MASRREIYKKKNTGFGIVDERRIVRAVDQTESRRHRRSELFTINRKLDAGSSLSTPTAIDTQQVQQDAQDVQKEDRRTKLLKWKAEKEMQKLVNKRLKQPVFRAGVYQHKLNSPIFLHQSLRPVKPAKPASPRITRATAKRIAAKNNMVVKDKSCLISTRSAKSGKSVSKLGTLQSSIAPKNHQFKAPDGLTTLKLFCRESSETMKTNQDTLPPVYFSPYVVSARGKRASRNEQRQNMSLGEYTGKETESKGNGLKASEKCEEEENLTTSHFRALTQKEVTRLKGLCQHWSIVKSDDTIPEDSQQVISQAIGQTNLFINKKVEQFKKLISDCENGTGEKLVTCQDLQGFWEMMYMQVEDCDSRFTKLTKLQERNWEEDEPIIRKKTVAATAKKTAVIKKVIPTKSTSVRDMIRAARRKQMESQKSHNSPEVIVSDQSSGAIAGPAQLSTVKFDGGFFMVQSPKKTATPRSVKKSASSLLQQPELSNETRRRRSALSVLRLSQKLKPPEIKPVEVESDPTIAYVNSQQTPGRSILKRIDALESASCSKKSQNKVIFTKPNQKTIDSNSSWRGEPSDANESPVSYVTVVGIRKCLDLSDSDLDVEETEDQLDVGSEASDSGSDQRNQLMDKEVFDDRGALEDKIPETDQTITDETITDRTITDQPPTSSMLRKTPANITRSTRRSRKGIINELNEMTSESSNIKAIKSNTLLTEDNLTAEENQKENEVPNTPEVPKQRRSTRKSVKFSGATCTGCKWSETPNADSTDNNKVKTPSSQTTKDLISWETPKDPAPRVRRSLRLKNSKQ